MINCISNLIKNIPNVRIRGLSSVPDKQTPINGPCQSRPCGRKKTPPLSGKQGTILLLALCLSCPAAEAKLLKKLVGVVTFPARLVYNIGEDMVFEYCLFMVEGVYYEQPNLTLADMLASSRRRRK